MTFRARLQLALATIAIATVGGLGVAVRRQMADRLTAEYDQRVTTLADVIHDDLSQERLTIGTRLRALAHAIPADNGLRTALINDSNKGYVLDYAGDAMRLSGLSMLQIEDALGHVISSGHFRNDFGRLDSLPFALPRAEGAFALTVAQRPEGPFLALVRLDSTRVGERLLYIVGGVELDQAHLKRLARDAEVVFVHAADSLSSRVGPAPARVIERDLDIPFVGQAVTGAKLIVRQSVAPLDALLATVNRWSLLATLFAVLAALVAAWWFSSSLSRPIAALADDMTALKVEKLEGTFAGTDRDDEVGALARGLTDLVDRLRRGANQLREAERRATTGDLARQVNHDVKNGLAPIRNVIRHLATIAHDTPAELPAVFRERKDTLDKAVAYLETLSANYARLTPKVAGGAADIAGVVAEIGHGLPADVVFRTRIAPGLPPVRSDPVVLRRILDNVIMNAVDSVHSEGSITVSAELAQEPGGGIRIAVVDTGSGMNEIELQKAFQDFYTTKPGGTGLGLSIVRRLVTDLGGTLKVTSEPGTGTRVEIVIAGAYPRTGA